MRVCAASGCFNKSGNNIKLHSFPKDANKRLQWMRNAGLKGNLSQYAVICDVHFSSEMWEKIREDGRKKLKANAVPTIFRDCQKLKSKEKFKPRPVLHPIDLNYTNVPEQSNQDVSNILPEPTTYNIVGPKKNPIHCQKMVSLLTGKHVVQISPPMIKYPATCEDLNKNSGLDIGVKKGLSIHSGMKENMIIDNVASNLRIDKQNKIIQKQEIELDNLHNTYTVMGPQSNLMEKYLKLEKLYSKSEQLRKLMQKRHKDKYRKWLLILTRLQRKYNNLYMNLPSEIKKVFSDDQLEVLSAANKKPLKWSDSSLTKGYQLKFACGNNGYRELIKQGIPLPSVRSLSRHLESWKFGSGILYEVFEFLKIKIGAFENPIYKDCILTLDEVSITKGKVFDISTNSYVGYVTLKDETSQVVEYADNFLVFMLAGISKRWKQPVAYYYTNKTTDGKLYYPVIIEILRKADVIGLSIHAVVSDMGPSNQTMWSMFGISASRFNIVNKCLNPINKTEYLYFFQDAPHALKNFKEGFMNHTIMTIADKFIKKYSLPSNEANSKHFEELLDFQNKYEFKLAPKLKEEFVRGNRHFRKMRVENSSRVLNHAVGTSLQYLAQENNKPDYETTAWLVNIFHKWWNLTSCRQLNLALSKSNLGEFEKAKEFLLEFIEIIKTLKVGKDKEHARWKPYQTGLLLTTQSTLELSEYLLDKKEYQFVFGARFTQDCLENLFSSLRAKNVILNALQAKNNLKIICVSAYMKNPSTGSYDSDDREMVSGFLSFISNESKKNESHSLSQSKIIKNIPILPINAKLGKVELNLLHHVAGYLMHSIIINNTICKSCITLTGCFKASVKQSKLTSLRCYKEETLFFVNRTTFDFFLNMELIFRTYFNLVHSIKNLDLKAFFVSKFSDITYDIPQCHKLKIKIMKRYASYRLKIKSDKLKKTTCILSSKSMYMHHTVN